MIIIISGRQWRNTGIIMTNEWNRVIQKKGESYGICSLTLHGSCWDCNWKWDNMG